MFGMWFFVSLYLQQVLGYSPLGAGLAFLPMTLTIIVGSWSLPPDAQVRGQAAARDRHGAPDARAAAVFARVADGSYLSDVLAPSLLVAAGLGVAFVPATIAALAGVAPEESGLASGLVNTSRQMGGALGLLDPRDGGDGTHRLAAGAGRWTPH